MKMNALANPKKIFAVRGHSFNSNDRGFLVFHMRRVHTILFMAACRRNRKFNEVVASALTNVLGGFGVNGRPGDDDRPGTPGQGA